MKVIWTSEERVIPGYGVAATGKSIELPDALAAQFINQGEAEVTRGDPKSRRTKDEE